MTFFMYHDTWQMVRASIVLLLIEYTFFVIQVFEQDADYFWTDHYNIHFETFKNEAIIVINTWYDSHVIFMR